MVSRVSCYTQQGNNTPTHRQRSGQLGNLTHRATIRSLPRDLFCLCCINCFLSYRFPVGCRPALTACSFKPSLGKTMLCSHSSPTRPTTDFALLPNVSATACLRIDVRSKEAGKTRMHFVLRNKKVNKTTLLTVHMMPLPFLHETNKSVT